MTEKRERIPLGAELKLIVPIQPISGLSADDYEFEIEAKAWQQKSVKFKKSETIREDENSRIIIIDTNKVGYGILMLRLIAQIPDSDMSDQYRTEICNIDPMVEII